MESSQTLNMTGVTISNVGTGVWMKQGTLTIKEGSIGFKGGENNYGVMVGGTATATITGTRITGEGKGRGVYATGAKAVTLERVDISGVKMGVEVTSGNLTVSGGNDRCGDRDKYVRKWKVGGEQWGDYV
ncbi:right-handed parallel beta-helix repeat-containing protein [Bartonella bovis]|uniref:right-handed parallel beta-helix repeat-containing protein n=1 Tax=Bartonella bovis TaxID=155194 RepID=UPI0011AF6E5F|nr:right-handed parallel beta-helix repeat-containing protein [Bartonella bovis]